MKTEERNRLVELIMIQRDLEHTGMKLREIARGTEQLAKTLDQINTAVIHKIRAILGGKEA